MKAESQRERARRPVVLGFSIFFGLLLSSGVLVHAQSGRSYSIAKAWWDAGRGLVFPRAEQYDDPTGELTVLNTDGVIHPEGHPFFEVLGTNGRACITCHQPANAMSISTVTLEQRWMETQGHDPVFAAVDGANCPDLPPLERTSHSLLIDRGLFRMMAPWPPRSTEASLTRPEFEIQVDVIRPAVTPAPRMGSRVPIPPFPCTGDPGWLPISERRHPLGCSCWLMAGRTR